MKKLIIFGILTIFLLSCETQQTIIDVPENVNLPKQVKVIAQSCDMDHLYQTVIDLSNNEIVILVYSEINLINVIRTGIKANPDKQVKLPDSNAPANESDKPGKTRKDGIS